MNIMNVTKKIPLYCVWNFDSEDKKQVKAICYEIEFSLRTEASKANNDKQAYLHQNISYQTINSFIFDQLHQTIIYDLNSKKACERAFASHDNNFMILPELSEACLVTALHSKLNAICHENSFVEYIKLAEKTENLCYDFFTDDGEYESLPSIEEWLGELSFWDKPWWERRDFSKFDNVAENKEELDVFLNDDANKGIIERMQSPIAEIEGQVIADIYKKEIKDIMDTKAQEKGELLEVDFKNKTFKPKLVPKDK